MNLSDLEPHPRDWPELWRRARDPDQHQAMTPSERRVVADLEAGRRTLPRGQPQSFRVLFRKQALAEIVAIYQANGEKREAAIQLTAEANGITAAAVEKAIRDFKKWRGALRWQQIKARHRRTVA